jgi:hypothetical protein
MARKRGWGSGSSGGVHLHHEVVGIVLVLIAGLMFFTRAGTEMTVRNACAIVFGVGAAFILDEFGSSSTCATSTGRMRAATRSTRPSSPC